MLNILYAAKTVENKYTENFLYFKPQPVIMSSFLILFRIVVPHIYLRQLISQISFSTKSFSTLYLSPMSLYHTIHSELLFPYTCPFLLQSLPSSSSKHSSKPLQHFDYHPVCASTFCHMKITNHIQKSFGLF